MDWRLERRAGLIDQHLPSFGWWGNATCHVFVADPLPEKLADRTDTATFTKRLRGAAHRRGTERGSDPASIAPEGASGTA